MKHKTSLLSNLHHYKPNLNDVIFKFCYYGMQCKLMDVLSNTNIKHLVTNKLYSVLRVTQTHFSFS